MRLRAKKGLIASALLLASSALAQTAWEPRGIGGGGALFNPSFSPHDPQELRVACDVTQPFVSSDRGRSWGSVPFQVLRGGFMTGVHYTSDPQRLYALGQSPVTDSGAPHRSLDGGLSWEPLPGDPTGDEAWSMLVDPNRTDRVLVSSYTTLFLSNDGGDNFAVAANDGGGLHVAGAHFDGDRIFVGTSAGVFASMDGGMNFAPLGVPGIPGGDAIVSLAGATDSGGTRLVAVTLNAGDVYPGVRGTEHWGFSGVFVLDEGSLAWERRETGIPAGHHPFFVACSPTDTSVFWLAGSDDVSWPTVHRSTDGATTWSSVFDAADNGNVATGWCGDGGDRGWGYAELAFGFAVSPVDPAVAAFSDFGFVHVSEDGGGSWRQAYLDASTQNPAGARTPRGSAYGSSGLENTSHWGLEWVDADTIVSAVSDIRGIRSTDGGATWSYPDFPHNSTYRVQLQPSTGTLHAVTSTAHDLYQTTYLQDARIDGADGHVISSTDGGASWQLVHDFDAAVVWIELDPNDADRAWASVVDSATGGIFATTDLSAGAASTWTLLPSPARTEGHPFVVRLLPDGALAASWSARRDGGGAFTESSGVFLSDDDGQTWQDRSDPDMRWYTKDFVLDPHDPTGSTWLVGVWSGWGGPPNDRGGLFRTTDRGLNWTRLWNSHRVSSVTVSPDDPDLAYVTTEIEGLWRSEDFSSAAPTFQPVDDFPHPHPERVFFDPHVPGQVWVASFGGGLRVLSAAPTEPALLRASLSSLRPVVPDPLTVLPLMAPRDVHVPAFMSGDLDPDDTVVGDPSRPLVFYALDADVELSVSLQGTRIRLDHR